jgi:rubrerythrin
VTESSTEVKAIELAIEAERKAAAFYAAAADKSVDPRGRDMFLQLARFEQGHYEYLKGARDSLMAGKDYPVYPGQDFEPTRFDARVPVEEAAKSDLVGAISIAIEAERRAEAEYRRLAEAARSEAGRAFFLRLAAEEGLHEKVLGIQFYAIHNQGVLTWGD